MKASVLSINISQEKGTVKKPINEGIFVTNHGLEKDAHAGDWHRQVSLLAVESYDKIKVIERLPLGSFAENITTEGIVLHTLPAGTKIQIGDTIQKKKIGKKGQKWWEIKTLVGDCVMPREGVFSKVLEGGLIKVGDEIKVLKEQTNV